MSDPFRMTSHVGYKQSTTSNSRGIDGGRINSKTWLRERLSRLTQRRPAINSARAEFLPW